MPDAPEAGENRAREALARFADRDAGAVAHVRARFEHVRPGPGEPVEAPVGRFSALRAGVDRDAATILGNVGVAIPVAIALSLAATQPFDRPATDPAKACRLLADLDPVRGGALAYAAIAGVHRVLHPRGSIRRRVRRDRGGPPVPERTRLGLGRQSGGPPARRRAHRDAAMGRTARRSDPGRAGRRFRRRQPGEHRRQFGLRRDARVDRDPRLSGRSAARPTAHRLLLGRSRLRGRGPGRRRAGRRADPGDAGRGADRGRQPGGERLARLGVAMRSPGGAVRRADGIGLALSRLVRAQPLAVVVPPGRAGG